MSALWTPGRAGVSPGFLRHSPAPASQARPRPAPARGPVEGRPFEITDMALPAACAGARWSWFDAGSAPSRPELVYSTRVGIC